MIRNIRKTSCPCCNKEFAVSHLVIHLKLHHNDFYHKILYDVKEKRAVYETTKCACGNALPTIERLDNTLVLTQLALQVKELPKYCSKKCHEEYSQAWNKGLTKDTDPRMLALSEARMGENNPIHKVVAEPERYENWIKNLKISNKEAGKLREGKTLEEILGEEKAKAAKDKMSAFQSTRTVQPHAGHHHTDETKEVLRQKATLQQLGANKTSTPQLILHQALLNAGLTAQLEAPIGYYLVDILVDSFAIEVDGDFYHVNEERGFTVKYDIQRRNKINEKRKNTYLTNLGFTVVRIWESDINQNLDGVVQKILSMVSSNV